MSVNLTLDEMLQNPNFKISIGTPDGKFISGVNSAEFVLGGSSEFTNFNTSKQDELSQKLNGVKSATNTLLGTEFAQSRLVNRAHTVKSWANSEIDNFSVELIFVNTSPDKDVLDPVKTMLAGVLPEGELTLTAPYGYKGVATDTTGTWSLSIGRWFMATGLLLQNVSAPISVESMHDGKPLYTKITATFTLYRLMTKDEFLRFFLL